MNALRLLLLIAYLTTFGLLSTADCDELNFRLDDLDGNSISLEKKAQPHLTVVCFIGTECPLAKLYSGRLERLAANFTDVDFIAVSSNQQ
ncbi:redoxin domain-containing protein, partial [bacterium]|nr:redoxin domain-containing protein [bacterium]